MLAGCGSDGVIDLLPPRDGGGADSAADAGSDVVSSDAPLAETAVEAGVCTDCGGVCFDLENDPSHCGACTTSCAHYQYCRSGKCACLPGFTLCGDGSCHDLASDPDRCGSCTHPPCNAGEKCENGVCGAGACTTGLTGCPVANSRTACVELSRGLPYCGDCTTVCGPDQVCAAGACRSYAPATPCTTCPCTADCARTEGASSTCCAPIAGGTQVICVQGTTCP